MNFNVVFFKLQATLACNLKYNWKNISSLLLFPGRVAFCCEITGGFHQTLILYLRMLLLFVVLKLWPGHRLLTHITQCNVSPTVDLMGGEISLWNIVFTEERNTLPSKTKKREKNSSHPLWNWPLQWMALYEHLPVTTELCIFISHGYQVTCWQVEDMKKTNIINWNRP